ncbi:hypothetical protein [Moorena sp. SIO3I8]|nr:hypothetical protein [Moorena sp. SIO3I8]
MPLASSRFPTPYSLLPTPCSGVLQPIALCYNYYKTNLTIPLVFSA